MSRSNGLFSRTDSMSAGHKPERILRVITVVRREVQQTSSRDQWKKEWIPKELETYETIVQALKDCHERNVEQAILTEVFERAKEIWYALSSRNSVEPLLKAADALAEEEAKGKHAALTASTSVLSPRRKGSIDDSALVGSNDNAFATLAAARPMTEEERRQALALCKTNEEKKIEQAHQEWDDEIMRLQRTVDEKISRMQGRGAGRGGGLMSASTSSVPTRPTAITSTTSPQPSLSKPKPSPQVQASIATRSPPPASASGAAGKISQVPRVLPASNGPASKVKSPRSGLGGSMLSLRSSEAASSTSVGDSTMRETQFITFVTRAANDGAHIGKMLQESTVDVPALNAKLRSMVTDTKSAADLLTDPVVKSKALDLCRDVLTNARDYFLDQKDMTKKLALVKTLTQLVLILKEERDRVTAT